MAGLTEAPVFQLPDGWITDLASGQATRVNSPGELNSYTETRPLTQAEITQLSNTWNSQQSGRDVAAQQDAANSGGLGDFFQSLLQAAPAVLTAGAFGGGLTGLLGDAAGAGGITADSIQAGILGGENAAGGMYGAGALGGGVGDTSLLGGSGGDMLTDPNTGFNAGDTGTTGMNADQFGNFDMGGGVTGTDLTGQTTAAAAGAGGSAFPDWYNSALSTLGATAGSPTGSVLSRILDGSATAADWASLGGQAAGVGLNYLGSQDVANSLTNIANQSRNDRLPFLNAATGWLNDPASYYNSAPATAAMDATLRGLSVRGNPLGNGTSLALANQAGLQNWQNAVTGFGNIGLSGQDSRNQLLSQAATTGAQPYTALGGALGTLTSQNSLSDLLSKYFPKISQSTGLV